MYEIKQLDIGLTNKCNAGCPQCARTNENTFKAQPWLELVELRLADIKQIIPPDQCRKIKTVALCGSYGDPLVAKDVLEIISYFYECNPGMGIYIATNGSMRTEKFWYKLANILKGRKAAVTFGIDGINQEQHARYRVHTKLDRIFRHAEILKMHRIKIKWQYLVFDYNKDDVEKAREMAKEKRFDKFFTLVTERPQVLEFKAPEGMKPNGREQSNPWHKEVDYIDCIAKNNEEVHITAHGEVIPCCYLDHILAATKYFPEMAKSTKYELKNKERISKARNARNDIDELFQDLTIFDGRKHTVEGVVSNPWWDKLLKNQMNISKCRMTCGKCYRDVW